MRTPLRGPGLRAVGLEPAPLLLGAQAGAPRDPPDDAVQGRVHRERVRRGRRQPGLREHALPAAPRLAVLLGPAVGGARRLACHARPPLPPRGADARRDHLRGGRAGGPAARRDRGRARGRGHPAAHPRGRVPRRGGTDRAGPLLRRRGPGSRRLHPVRLVHGGLPPQRQEHARQELPLVRRAERRPDRAGAHRRGHPPARPRRRRRRLRGHERTVRRLDPQGPPRADRARRGGRGRSARHEPAAPAVPAERVAPAALRSARAPGAVEQRGDRRGHDARRPARLHEVGRDHVEHLDRRGHPRRERDLRPRRGRDERVLHRAHGRGHEADAAAEGARARSPAGRSSSCARSGPSGGRGGR